jgi:hypothetical protein
MDVFKKSKATIDPFLVSPKASGLKGLKLQT